MGGRGQELRDGEGEGEVYLTFHQGHGRVRGQIHTRWSKDSVVITTPHPPQAPPPTADSGGRGAYQPQSWPLGMRTAITNTYCGPDSVQATFHAVPNLVLLRPCQHCSSCVLCLSWVKGADSTVGPPLPSSVW